MFSTCSELTPRAPIPDGRMEQIVQPCPGVNVFSCPGSSLPTLGTDWVINSWFSIQTDQRGIERKFSHLTSNFFAHCNRNAQAS